MLRCRCKRKATEHDATKRPHKSLKPALAGVICEGFASPWVCNCGCPWSNHQQRYAELKVVPLTERLGLPPDATPAKLNFAADVQPDDMSFLDAGLKRGGFGDQEESQENVQVAAARVGLKSLKARMTRK